MDAKVRVLDHFWTESVGYKKITVGIAVTRLPLAQSLHQRWYDISTSEKTTTLWSMSSQSRILLQQRRKG